MESEVKDRLGAVRSGCATVLTRHLAWALVLAAFWAPPRGVAAPGATLLIDEPEQTSEKRCLPGGTSLTIRGRHVEPDAGDGSPRMPLAVRVVVRDSDGSVEDLAARVRREAGGVFWEAGPVGLGESDGNAVLEAIASLEGGGLARAVRSVRIDAGTPSLRLEFEGRPCSAGGELFARPVGLHAWVADGAESAPPRAELTLDGEPYRAGERIDAEGEHLLEARVEDCAGHVATARCHFRIDRTPPSLLSLTPHSGAKLAAWPEWITGRADELLSSVRLLEHGRFQRASTSVKGPSFRLEGFRSRVGVHVLEIELADEAGNRSRHELRYVVAGPR